MSADVAIGVSAISAFVGAVVGYFAIAATLGLWPFRPDPPIIAIRPCPVCGEPLDEGEEPCDADEMRAVSDLWSGVDTRHGEDGNSGHG